jgi:hypothetical protein
MGFLVTVDADDNLIKGLRNRQKIAFQKVPMGALDISEIRAQHQIRAKAFMTAADCEEPVAFPMHKRLTTGYHDLPEPQQSCLDDEPIKAVDLHLPEIGKPCIGITMPAMQVARGRHMHIAVVSGATFRTDVLLQSRKNARRSLGIPTEFLVKEALRRPCRVPRTREFMDGKNPPSVLGHFGRMDIRCQRDIGAFTEQRMLTGLGGTVRDCRGILRRDHIFEYPVLQESEDVSDCP